MKERYFRNIVGTYFYVQGDRVQVSHDGVYWRDAPLRPDDVTRFAEFDAQWNPIPSLGEERERNHKAMSERDRSVAEDAMRKAALPVVWMPHFNGINAVLADELRGRGCDVRSFEVVSASPQEAKSPPHWHGDNAQPPESATRIPKYEDRIPAILSSDQLEKLVGYPSPMSAAAHLEERTCESLRGISSPVTISIGVLNVNLGKEAL